MFTDGNDNQTQRTQKKEIKNMMTVKISDSANVTFSLTIETTDDAKSLINILSVLDYGTEEFDTVDKAIYGAIKSHLDGDFNASDWDEWFRTLGYYNSICDIKNAGKDFYYFSV